MLKELVLIVGARPNFMKAAPIVTAAKSRDDLKVTLVHTGQHYDLNMSDRFFEDLQLPRPDVYFGVGSGSHALQTANVMTAFDRFLDERAFDCVVVVGDVNSTLAAAVVASKREIPVAHVEAGLRSFDRSMPEEVNRILTDAVSNWLLTPSLDANENLRAEGIRPGRLFFVGNVMIDSLFRATRLAGELRCAQALGIDGPYGYVTLHRPANVDSRETLQGICDALRKISQELALIFPVHPRTRRRLEEFNLVQTVGENVTLAEPVGYLESVNLTMFADVVLTDSGGLQEETTALGVSCLTLRPNTERPITVSEGTNVVVGNATDDIVAGFESRQRGPKKNLPRHWDGRASERVLDALAQPPPRFD